MGLGTPPQLLKMVALGVDMFDCVLPTRVARNGLVFTPDGPMNLRNEQYRADPRPIVEGLANYTANFSRAYLRHLTLAGEILSPTLLTIHNLHFFLDLMAQARAHIEAGDYRPVASRLDRALRSRCGGAAGGCGMRSAPSHRSGRVAIVAPTATRKSPHEIVRARAMMIQRSAAGSEARAQPDFVVPGVERAAADIGHADRAEHGARLVEPVVGFDRERPSLAAVAAAFEVIRVADSRSDRDAPDAGFRRRR